MCAKALRSGWQVRAPPAHSCLCSMTFLVLFILGAFSPSGCQPVISETASQGPGGSAQPLRSRAPPSSEGPPSASCPERSPRACRVPHRLLG